MDKHMEYFNDINGLAAEYKDDLDFITRLEMSVIVYATVNDLEISFGGLD